MGGNIRKVIDKKRVGTMLNSIHYFDE